MFFSYKIILENQFKLNKNQLELINNRISNIPDEKIKQYFENEISKMKIKLEENYKMNYETITNFMTNQKINERLSNLMFMFLGGIILLLTKELFF